MQFEPKDLPQSHIIQYMILKKLIIIREVDGAVLLALGKYANSMLVKKKKIQANTLILEQGNQ